MFVGVNYGGSKGPTIVGLPAPRTSSNIHDDPLGDQDSYGWDFGFGYIGSASGGHWRPTVAGHPSRAQMDLEVFQDVGVTVVRWFILGDGLSYGRASTDFSSNQPGVPSVFNPPLIGERVARADLSTIVVDFKHLLGLFRNIGRGHRRPIQIMPVVTDFLLPVAGGPLGGFPHLIKGGRESVFGSHSAQFFLNFLTPLLDAAREFSDVVYAWDLCNEPDWLLGNCSPAVTPANIRAFFQDGVALIKSKGFKATVGYAHFDTMLNGLWDTRATPHVRMSETRSPGLVNAPGVLPRLPAGLDCDVHQFHYYGNVEMGWVGPHIGRASPKVLFGPKPLLPSPRTPSANVAGLLEPDRPVVMGELSMYVYPSQYPTTLHSVATSAGPPVPLPSENFLEWPTVPRIQQNLMARLKMVSGAGYDGAILWHATRSQRLKRKKQATYYECAPNDFWSLPGARSGGTPADPGDLLDWRYLDADGDLNPTRVARPVDPRLLDPNPNPSFSGVPRLYTVNPVVRDAIQAAVRRR
jgi:hypothetical protein